MTTFRGHVGFFLKYGLDRYDSQEYNPSCKPFFRPLMNAWRPFLKKYTEGSVELRKHAIKSCYSASERKWGGENPSVTLFFDYVATSSVKVDLKNFHIWAFLIGEKFEV